MTLQMIKGFPFLKPEKSFSDARSGQYIFQERSWQKSHIIFKMWYLDLDLSYRKQFIQYIMYGYEQI